MAVYQLEKENYQDAAKVFQPLSDFQPLCAAVIAGLQEGNIWVDQPENPQAAFLVVWENWGFLAGAPTNNFVEDLRTALFNRTVVGEKVEYMILTIEEDRWAKHLPALCHPRHAVPAKRRHYTASQIEYDWRSQVPDGFEIQPMSTEMLKMPNLPEEVKQTLERWQANEHPDFKDCGCTAIFQGEVAAWATVDAISGGQGDIGLVTQEPFRRKGLATITSAAAAELAFSAGANTIHWTCMENNLGSIRTAEKLGLKFHSSYQVYFFEFDELWDQIQYAGHLINLEEYHAGLLECQKALTLTSDPPPALLIYTARAQAMTSQAEQALASLNRLVKTGWKDASFLENDQRFTSLQNTDQWKQLIAGLKQDIPA